MALSPMAGKYDARLDRNSAFEMLPKRAHQPAKEPASPEEKPQKNDTPAQPEFNSARRYAGKGVTRSTSRAPRRKSQQGFGAAVASVVIKELKGTTGRPIVRGSRGGLLKGR